MRRQQAHAGEVEATLGDGVEEEREVPGRARRLDAPQGRVLERCSTSVQ